MRVLLIEDDDAFRLGLEAYLLTLPFVEAVATASDGEQGLALLARHGADVVVLDLGLPGLGGLETCRRIRGTGDLPVLVLTSQQDEVWVRRLWEAGASGYLHKGEALEQLAMALPSLLQGASWWDRGATRALRDDAAAPPDETRPGTGTADTGLAALTPRERQVLDAMAGGLTNRQIAETLGIGAGTVRIHLQAIFQKLQVRNRTQAVLRLLNRP